MQPDPKHEKTLRRIQWLHETFNLAVYYFACYMVFRYWLDMIFWKAFPMSILLFVFHMVFRTVEKPIIERLVRPFVKDQPREDQE